jgi:hypothetical protein
VPTATFAWDVVASGAEGPGPRSRHGLVYDSGVRATVLFGGIIWTGRGRMQSDTWELRSGRWSRVETPQRPAARHRGAMVYDKRRAFSVLFGGQGQWGTFFGDTWLYEDRHWSRRRYWWNRPSPRCGHAMAFDEEAGMTILFGGIDPYDKPLGDTWLFNGDSWRRLRRRGPPARRYAAFAYSPDLHGCVLHGGAVDDLGRKKFGDTWLFRGDAWEGLPDEFETDARDDHGLAYHRAAGALVMLEGVSGARGILQLSSTGWEPVYAAPLHPRHQCSPLAWDDGLNGLVLHGGEAHHGGAQFDTTWVLRVSRQPRRASGTGPAGW